MWAAVSAWPIINVHITIIILLLLWFLFISILIFNINIIVVIMGVRVDLKEDQGSSGRKSQGDGCGEGWEIFLTLK